jgi:hypothetical protein
MNINGIVHFTQGEDYNDLTLVEVRVRRAVEILLALLGCAIFGLVVTLVLSGIGESGVINMQITHALFWLAFGISIVAAPLAAWLISQSLKHSVLALIGTVVVLGGGLLWLDSWLHKEKDKQDAANQPPSPLRTTAPPPTIPIIKLRMHVSPSTINQGNGAGARVTQHSEGNNSPNSVTFGNNSPITFTTLPCIPGKPRIADGPDPYRGVCHEDLADWAIKEADKIQGMADKCKYDGSQGLAESGDSFTNVIWQFNSRFKDCCTDRVKQLRKEVVNRLGPSYADEREQSSWDMLFMDDKFPPGPNQAPRQIDCMQVQDYAPHLRKLGRQLKRRVTSRMPPKPLHFVETQLPATPTLCKTCDFGVEVTISTDSPVAGGYVVAEFTPAPGAYVSDVGRIIILGHIPLENEPLEKYLEAAFPRGTSNRGYLTADLPEDVFGPSKPVHLTVFSPYKFKVDKVTLFDE